MSDKYNLSSPLALIILDGFGWRSSSEGNAVSQAAMPHFTSWRSRFPFTLLNAHGEHVGLPEHTIGNSEVGHKTIGSGRITKSILARINESMASQEFYNNDRVYEYANDIPSKRLHLIGLLSNGGVHSHEDHLYALIKTALNTGIRQIFIHAILDGRDTPPFSAPHHLKKLQSFLKTVPEASLASVHGRFYAMDRDENWQRTEKSYKVMCEREQNFSTYGHVLEKLKAQSVSEEFFPPMLLDTRGTISNGDGIVCFNFRPERMHQLVRMILKRKVVTPFCILTMSEYDPQFTAQGCRYLFKELPVNNTLLDVLDAHNKTLFRCAETEKCAHITYFFDGQQEKKHKKEIIQCIPSEKSDDNYSSHPEMSAQRITDTVLTSLHKDPAFFYLINYANADMVGHSGNVAATRKACQVLDHELKRLVDEIVNIQNGTIIITADHGNAEEMIGSYRTSHTCNPVPFMVLNKKLDQKNCVPSAPLTRGLSHIAPTLLHHLNLAIPHEMEDIRIF